MDPPEVAALLPPVLRFEIDGVKIGVAHPREGGAPWGIRKRLLAKFRDPIPDVLIYGHTHSAACERDGSVLYFNPGTAGGTFIAPRATYGKIKIETGRVAGAEIVKV